MESVLPLAGAALVLLEVAGAITKKTERLLPIGGSHIAQMAIVFGSAFVVYEIMSVLR
jgi:hypothetical protein